jgi:hypothetical protein
MRTPLGRRSKTDQKSTGQIVPVLRGSRACPVMAVKAWLSVAPVENRPVFRRVAKGGKALAKRRSREALRGEGGLRSG